MLGRQSMLRFLVWCARLSISLVLPFTLMDA